ncbi:hypothetical protein BSPWISOX_2101 [uncultured Gammaproteobacteria bacterium]|nr:hypothetical protein BSPWISOX_2101 [uncultured Gammaproteobacteria bacterium]
MIAVHHHIGGLENNREYRSRQSSVHHHIGGLEMPNSKLSDGVI